MQLVDTSRRRARFQVVVLALLLAACQDAPQDHLAAAKLAIAAGDRGSALIALKNAVAGDPKSGEARLLLAEQLIESGEYAAAIADLRRARELKAPDDRAAPLLAEALLNTREYKLLLELLGELRLSTPEAQARLRAQVAHAHMALDNLAAAKQAAEQAVLALPQSPHALMAKARIALREQGVAAALTAADAIVKDAPRFAEGWTFKGTLHAMREQEAPAARAAFLKALEADPREFQALFSLSALEISGGNLPKARTLLDNLRKHWPNSVYGRYLEARILLLEGKHEQARPMFAEARNFLPGNASLLLAAGINELQLGAHVQAEAMLAQASSLAPDLEIARNFLAQANLHLNRPERALQALAPLVAAPTAKPEVLVLAAQASLLLGDVRAADALYKRAEAKRPDSEDVRIALALAKVAKGDVDAALKDLDSIAAKSSDIDADLRLVSTHLAQGAHVAALEALNRLETKKPGLVITRDLRGQALLAKGDRPGAREAFESALGLDRFYGPSLNQLTRLDVQAGRAKEAEARLAEVLKSKPSDSRLLTLLALVKTQAGGSAQESLELLERATQADPSDANAWLALMSRHFQAGDLQAALSVGRTAVSMVPDHVPLMEMWGRIQLQTGDTRQAENTFTSLIRVAPRSASGYVGQAAALLAGNQPDAAAQTLRRLIEMQPDLIDARTLAADVALRQKRYDQALTQARELQRRHPGHAAGYRLEGTVEQTRNNLAAAAVAYRRGLGKEAAADLPVRLYGVLVRRGAGNEAQQFADDWVKANPQETDLRAFLGALRLNRSDWAGAQAYFDAVLRIDPNHLEALNNSAMAFLGTNDGKSALARAELALKGHPNHPEVLDTLARAQVAAGEPRKAVETMRRAINRATNPAPLRLNLAKLYIQLEDKANAAAELEILVALGRNTPTFAEARKLLSGLRKS